MPYQIEWKKYNKFVEVDLGLTWAYDVEIVNKHNKSYGRQLTEVYIAVQHLTWMLEHWYWYAQTEDCQEDWETLVNVAFFRLNEAKEKITLHTLREWTDLVFQTWPLSLHDSRHTCAWLNLLANIEGTLWYTQRLLRDTKDVDKPKPKNTIAINALRMHASYSLFSSMWK